MKRRTAISTGLAAITAVTSGCGAYDFSAHRSLSVGRISVERSGSGWTLNATVKAAANGFSDEEQEAFHDVVLLVYSNEWDLICSKPIGDIPGISHTELIQVTLSCPAFPHNLTLSATESPCDKNTVIQITTYEGRFENAGRTWHADRRRQCGEGLPPERES